MPKPPKTINTLGAKPIDHRMPALTLPHIYMIEDGKRTIPAEQFWDREDRRNYGYHYEREDGPAQIVMIREGAILRWFGSGHVVFKADPRD